MELYVVGDTEEKKSFSYGVNIKLSKNCSDRKGRCEDTSWCRATQGQSSENELHNDKHDLITFVYDPFVVLAHNMPAKLKLIINCSLRRLLCQVFLSKSQININACVDD